MAYTIVDKQEETRRAANRIPVPTLLPMSLCLAVTTFTSASGLAAARSGGGIAPQFERDVRPILIARCQKCHGRPPRQADLDLRGVSSMRKGGALVPGSKGSSPLFRRIQSGAMPPPDEPQLTKKEVETIGAWIEAGAPADNPDRVYDKAVFESWGWYVVAAAMVNVIVVLPPISRKESLGYLYVLLAMVPMLVTGCLSLFRESPDFLCYAALAAMVVGLGIGGGLISRNKGYGAITGTLMGMFLSSAGVIGLVLLCVRPSESRPSQATSGSTDSDVHQSG